MARLPRLLAAASLAGAVIAAATQPSSAASRPPKFQYQITTLPNGLTVLVRRDRSAPVVAVVTYVKAGYFDETTTSKPSRFSSAK